MEIGAVNTTVVMPRPLEMTGRNEFPLYNFSVDWDAIVDIRFAQVLKLALDCTDDRIFNMGSGRNVMLKVKELDAHQAGCPSCLLLHTLLRWCALPSSNEKLTAVPSITSAINPQFFDKTKRKTALMALLSHWHTDICQQVKNLALDGSSVDQRAPSAYDQKVDLYHWLLSVHRERKERKSADLLSKDYLNPMDIIPQAFFYSFYMSRRLDWTNLDGLPLDQLSLSYAVVVSNVVINMVEQRVVCSAADISQKFITPHVHQMVHVNKVTVDGKLSWNIEMDDKGLLPVRGMQPVPSPGSIQSNATVQSRTSASWDNRVLDMMRDFEKNRSRSSGKKRGDVLTTVHGEVEIDSVRLESILTDLYVSLMVQLAEVMQHYNSMHNLNALRDGTESVVHKSRSPANIVDMKIRKACLTLMDNSKQNMHILNCTLHESNAKLTRQSGITSTIEPLIALRISLGAIEGELPMAAHSLHDVVMRHGPQELPIVGWDQVATPKYQSTGSSKMVAHPRPTIAKIKFDFETSNVELRALLLPSLLARYKLNRAYSSGVTGDAAKWTASIENHHVEFCVSSAGKPMDTFTLALPAIAVNGEYTVDKGDTAPATNKALLYREGGYLKMNVTLGQVNHSFTTDLLNQILFAEQSFRSELSALVSRLRAERSGWSPATTETSQVDKQPPMLFFLTVMGQGVPWLQLTAATPTATAVRFTIESLDAELTNRWVMKEHGSAKERLFGAAAIQFNAKLGQLVKVAEYEELQAELQEFATFMTQVRVENKESSSHQSYSYHIALNRPILLIKSSAVDKAILLWLNYKNTYDYWRAERSRVVRAANKRSNSFQHAVFSQPQVTQGFDVNLSLAINNGMYVCMPLYSQDLTDGMPALVLSLQKSDVTVCIVKELACQISLHVNAFSSSRYQRV
uniref:HAUS6_N domain-containing protein n=1 Tax=Angiostrongylus cantonensis TaxID=6313 RepID=A0A0K0DML4_ANGCA